MTASLQISALFLHSESCEARELVVRTIFLPELHQKPAWLHSLTVINNRLTRCHDLSVVAAGSPTNPAFGELTVLVWL